MSEQLNSDGMTTMAPDVLMTIAQLTTLKIDGVNSLTNAPVTWTRLLQPTHYKDGVMIMIDEDTIILDLFLNLNAGVDIKKTSLDIQKKVSREIHEITGIYVKEVNIHVEDVIYPTLEITKETA